MADRAGKTKPKRIRKKKILDPAKKNLPCEICGRKFYWQCDLKFHMLVHTGEKPYKCNVCGKAFNTPYSLKTHKYIHTDEKPYQCSFCEYACRDSSTLRKHQAKHGGKQTWYQCKTCDKAFLDKWRLKNHVAEDHLNINIRTIPCKMCNKMFKSNSQLNFHVKSIHLRLKSGHCPICKVSLTNMNNLPTHLATHVEARPRPYACNQPDCNNTYMDKSALKKHMSEKHFPERQYACDICGRVFSREYRVKSHVITVHGKRKRVECDYCGSRFFSKAYLINHITKKHMKRNKYKYICDICGLKTYNKPSIVMHLKYGHGNEHDVECKLCHSVFSKYQYLKHHYKYVHKIAYKTRPKQKVVIKEEPPDDDNISIASIDLFEIEKTEPEEPESITDTGNGPVAELDTCDVTHAEDTGSNIGLPELQTIIECERLDDIPKDVFEQFYVQTYKDHEFGAKKPRGPKPKENCIIDQKALDYVKQSTNQMISEAKKKEAELAIEREKILAEAKRKEAVKALERARKMYNQRISSYVEKLATESEHKSIKVKMFQPKRTKIKKDNKEQKSQKVNKKKTVTKTSNNKDINDETELTNTKFNDNIGEENGDSIDDPDNKIAIVDAILPDYNKDNTSNDINQIYNNKDEIQIEDNDVAEKISNLEDVVRNDDETKVSQNDDKQSSDEGEATGVDDDGDEEWTSKKKETKNSKIKFNSHQCYICFKLYETKEKLLDHCKIHFDVCNEISLKKCPLCPYVTTKNICRHIRLVHHIKLKIPYGRLQDKKDNVGGSRYYFEIKNPLISKMEVIPSVKNLNKIASMKIDKKNREEKSKTLAKTKLVRKGKEWIVETEKITINKDVIMPKFDEDAIKNVVGGKIGDSDSYFDSLKKMYHLAKKEGKTMLFPCQNCDKVCRNFAALKLHSRKHEANPKPFKKKVWKHKLTDAEKKKMEKRKPKPEPTNRTAKPKPIKYKHKCDPELKDFYKNNITGGDIEFWQFLKIFNKMSRDNIQDFEDLESRHEYGLIPEPEKAKELHKNKTKNRKIYTKSNTDSDEANKRSNDKPNPTHSKNKTKEPQKNNEICNNKTKLTNSKNNAQNNTDSDEANKRSNNKPNPTNSKNTKEPQKTNEICNNKTKLTNSKNNAKSNIDCNYLSLSSRKNIEMHKKPTKVNSFINKKGKDEKYKRVIRITKDEYNKRNAIKQKLREKISQNFID